MLEQRQIDPYKFTKVRTHQTGTKTLVDLSSVKYFFKNLKQKNDQTIYDALSLLTNDSLMYIRSYGAPILSVLFMREKVFGMIGEILFERKEQEERWNQENKLLISWIDVMKQDPGYSFPNNRTEMLQLATQFRTNLESVALVAPVVSVNRNIEGFYNAIPSSVLVVIAQLLPSLEGGGGDGGAIAIDDADILRYYVRKASVPQTVGDLLMRIIEKVLKKLLDVNFLPLPSATTVYLFCNWTAMLHFLTKMHYGNVFVSKEKIVAIVISILAVLMQLLNRETPLKLVKTIYSGSVQVKDFLSDLPIDVKKWLTEVFDMAGVNNSILNLALKNKIVTFNNNLGYFVGIENLSMNKALDMLYTFRIGNTFVQYATTGQGMDIHSLSDYWEKYGPLPEDGQQVEALLDLFRDDKKTYEERVNAIYNKYKPTVTSVSSYEVLLGCCGKIYEEMTQLNMYYLPFTCQVTPLFEVIPVTDHDLIYMIAGWTKSNSNNYEIANRSQGEVADDIFHSITEWVKHNN